MNIFENDAETPLIPYTIMGLLVGLVITIVDFSILHFFDIDIAVNGESAFWFVFLLLAVTFAILGMISGKLYEARKNLIHQNLLIERQLNALQLSQEKNLQLEKLASIGRLAAGVAHEVRNPLGVIRSAAGLIGEDIRRLSELGLAEEGYRNADKACTFIQKEVVRLDHFIAQLLDFSKPISAHFQLVSMNDIQKNLLELMEHEDHLKKVDLNILIQQGIPSFEGDLSLLTQAYFSLLKNAGEATGEKGKVNLEAVAEKDSLIVVIRDSGPGVKTADLERLFEPFFTTKALGTGLGLAMAERIIKGHGGKICYQLQKGLGPQGQGACFKVVIPLARVSRFLETKEAS